MVVSYASYTDDQYGFCILDVTDIKNDSIR